VSPPLGGARTPWGLGITRLEVALDRPWLASTSTGRAV